MGEPVIQNVSDTAFMVAMQRAMESERPDALFRDPLAAKVAGAHGREIIAKLPRQVAAGWVVVVRTVIIDDFIEAALARGADVVLNLGAGLDTRPYRMALPETLRWIEVDYPPVIELKESRLSSETPVCKVERVKLDLADLSARRRLFSEIDESSKHALVLTEGLIPYLNANDVGILADDLRRLSAARSWIADYLSPQMVRYRKKAVGRHFQNAPFKFEPEDWFAFFEQHGWRAKDKRFLYDEGIRLKRPIELPKIMRAWLTVRRLFLSRERRERMRQFAGYILLERV